MWIILQITHIAWTTLRVAHTLHNTTATTLLQERTSSNLLPLSCDTIADLLGLDGAGATKAFCDISIADSFVVNGLRIVEGKDGLFVCMPREEGKDGKWYNTVIPLKREVKDEIERVVMESYGS